MARPHPRDVGRKIATTDIPGLCYPDSTDFSIAEDGKFSLLATSAAETYATDSGTVTPAASSITVAGGEGIDTSGSGSTLTIAGEDATTSNKGIASFSSSEFSVSSGAVSHHEQFLQYAAVSLTNSEIKNLAATQKTLVAAPGAGKVVVFEKALLKLVAGSEVLTETADNLSIRYTDGTGVKVSDDIEATGFIDQSANTYTVAIPVKDAIVAATAGENAALVLDNDGDGEYGGNASNDATMEIAIWYRVATI